MTNQLLLLLWRSPDVDWTAFADQLLAAVGSDDGDGLRVAQCNVADHHVDAAEGLRQRALDPAPEALVRVKMPEGGDASVVYGEIEPTIAQRTGVEQVHGYAVSTREPLAGPSESTGAGRRSPGWSQVALLRHAPGMDTDAFRARWLDHHTRVALDIQSTFRYVQHLVEAPLSEGAPILDGIVEESFPTEAMGDPHFFFATGGDREILDQRINEMVASVSAFLDLGNLDVIPMSEYRFDR